MRLEQIKEPAEITAIRQACFSFEVPSNISVLLHRIRIDGMTVGYVATEDYNTVAAPHICVLEGYKNSAFLGRITWIFENVYCPLMRALGKEWLVTNCDDSDKGTINFLEKCGFDLKHLMVAQYKL